MASKFFYFFMLLMAPVVFSAEKECAEDGGTNIGGAAVGSLATVAARIPATSGCPDLSKLRNICTAVTEKTRIPIPGTNRTQLEFQAMLNSAACINQNDNENTKAQKIQTLWNDNQSSFRCSIPGFDIENGNILKLSVRKRSFEFLNMALDSWKLNLNIPDPVDGKTILDYVEKEIRSNGSNEISVELQEYRDLLRDSGAKRSSEL